MDYRLYHREIIVSESQSAKRVVITGIGIVSALGNNVDDFWGACLGGRTVVEPIPEHWLNYYDPKSRYWSPLALPDYSQYNLRRAEILSHDVAVLNAMVSADDALDSANMEKQKIDERTGRYRIDSIISERAGVFVGTGLGCITSAFNNYVPHLLSGIRTELATLASTGNPESAELLTNLEHQPRVNPLASCKSMANSISAALSIRYGFRGQNDTSIAACAAGTVAISRAFNSIRNGELDLAIAGGSEYYGDRAAGVFMAFDRLNTLVKPEFELSSANRPFDKRRSGFLFSQGASCMLLLESERHALRRGAAPIARIVGAANTSDAYSLVSMSPTDNAIEYMIRTVLIDAGLEPEDVNYVNAHGTSTEQNDEIEARILESIFGGKITVNSTKSLLGHTIGAAGAIEAAVTAMSISNQVVHPSLNIDEPISDLNFATSKGSLTINYALTHSFGFGGHDSGLILSCY
jgi:3-oxoacyl-[acyl-carrier-protein] synthase II